MIPYNRIGFSLMEPGGKVVARWARSDRDMILKGGYEAPLAGSTLQQVMEANQPRIINDLQAYLDDKPTSETTQLIVAEGMRSSLTCPLIVQGRPVGFIFFSSEQANTYSEHHVSFFQQIAGQLAVIVEKGRLYNALAEQKATIEEHNREMTRDLEMARGVQRAMIPRQGLAVPGLDVDFEYKPAIQIGGDALDIVPMGESGVLLLVADAMGHGVQAALVMSVVKTALHSAIAAGLGAAGVLERISRTLTEFYADQFVTALCCLMDGATGHARVAIAGHPSPIIWRAASGDVETLANGGIPLGIDPSATYEETSLDLRSGDGLLMFSDGIIEAFDTKRQQYGADRLTRVFATCAGGSAADALRAIDADLAAHRGPCELDDDLTILVVKKL